MANVKTVWLQGIPQEQQEAFKQRILSCKDVHKQFLNHLRNRYDSIERKGFNEEDYRSMDWTHVQAFNNGRLSIIREIAELFNFEGE